MNKRTVWLGRLMLILVLAIAMGIPALCETDDAEPNAEIALEAIEDRESLRESLELVNAYKHILVLGIDARPGESTGRTDTMVILSVHPENNSIKMISLMRDLYVEIPGRKNNRLNSAYFYGGAELLMETIEANFGVHIDAYVAVNFSMLANLIDQLGGLTLTVESEYYMKRINAVIRQDNLVLGIDKNDGLLTEWGDVLMTGKQAQAYARYRYGTKDGDFGRTARQREVLVKIFEKLSNMPLLELIGLAAANFENVYTNMTVQDMATMAPMILAMKEAEISQLRIPIDGGYSSKTVSGMAVLVPNRTKNMEAIASFLAE